LWRDKYILRNSPLGARGLLDFIPYILQQKEHNDCREETCDSIDCIVWEEIHSSHAEENPRYSPDKHKLVFLKP
jgi:hypothetical protein